jgi:hypothetical protein
LPCFADASARVRGKTMKNITLKEREEAEDMQAATGGGEGGREEKKDSRSQSSTPTRRGDSLLFSFSCLTPVRHPDCFLRVL